MKNLFLIFALVAAVPAAAFAADVNTNVQLWAASIRCDLNGVKGSLANGADPNFTDAEYTPLMGGANNGCIQIAQILLEAGANVNAYKNGICGYSATWLAAYTGHTSLIKLFVSKGADFNVKGGCYFETPLQIAVRYKNADTVAYLKSIGAQ